MFISDNKDANQLEIFLPSKSVDEVIVRPNGELKKTKTYRPSRKKMREVKFSEFRKADPVLQSFEDLKAPEVPQKICLLNEVHDFIAILAE